MIEFLYCFILVIACIVKIVYMTLPTIVGIILVQAIVYWTTGISIYNEFENFVLRGI